MKTITLDIEIIADPVACAAAGVDPAAGFPAWPLHQILCVSLLTHERTGWDEHQFAIETFSRADNGERAILAEVERRLDQCDTVVTYNGRGFDVPVLLARAAITGEHVPSIARAHNRAAAGYHADLLDAVTANGAAVRPKLAELCAGWGIPCKMELAGEGVATLAAAGEFGRVARYCETDVVATWLAAQMWRQPEQPGYGVSMWRLLAGWIACDQPRLAHLLPYCVVPDQFGGGRPLDQEAVDAILL